MVLPPPPCMYCTLQNGVYISDEDGSVQHLVDLSDKLINATCYQGFHCGRHPNATSELSKIGCCYPCSFHQSCPEAAISLNHPFTDNVCPGGYTCDPSPKICSSGEICFNNKRLDCQSVQAKAKEESFGTLFDGMYCEEGTSVMINCPTGYYCPNANDKRACPSGFFCPMKSMSPEIECVHCEVGSIKRARDNSYFVYLMLVIFVICIGIVTRRKKIKNGIHYVQVRSKEEDDDVKPFSTETPFEIIFRDLIVEVNCVHSYIKADSPIPNWSNRKRILNNVSGVIEPTKLCGILGPSGSGKSTLLNLLSGLACKGDVRGSVLVNGVEIKASTWNTNRLYSDVIGFVPQEDSHLQNEFTVWETLYWAARFHSISCEQIIIRRTQSVIYKLNLEHIRDAEVGMISGGERRRVSVGIALITEPRILICDEPTSGLDSSSSLSIMTLLKTLVDKEGVGVLCSLHQPREQIFSLLDDMILLSYGGNVIFSGETKDAIAYFENLGYYDTYSKNPADFFIDVSTGQGFNNDKELIHAQLSNNWIQHSKNYLPKTYPDSQVLSDLWDTDIKQNTVSPLSQYFYQVQRNFILVQRNWKSKCFNVFIIMLGSIIFSAGGMDDTLTSEELHFPISFEDIETRQLHLLQLFQFSIKPVFSKQEFAVKIATFCGVLIAMTSARSLSKRRVQFKYETTNGYNISSYFLAVTTVSLLEHGIQSFFAGAISFGIVQPLQSLFSYTFNFCMLGFVMSAWGQLFAVTVPPENLTVLSGPVLLGLNLLLSGVTKPSTFRQIYDNPYLAVFAGLLSPTRYFVETLVVSEVLCLPEQYGFTKPPEASKIDFTSLDILGLAQHDHHIQRNCNGWFYNTPVFVNTGILIRVLALIMIHITSRYNGFLRCYNYPETSNYIMFFIIIFVSLVVFNIMLILD